MLPDVIGSSSLRPEFREELGISHFKMGRSCRLLIVTGENAGGKSFIRRVFQAFLADRRPPIVSYTFCMEARSRSAEDANLLLGMAYGPEARYATSVNTMRAIRSILDTSEKASNDRRHVIILDEPEIGLSEESELAIGKMVAERLSGDWPHKRAGVVVMTHSRHVVRALMGIDGAKFLNLFDRYGSAEEWLEREVVPTDLDVLDVESQERFRRLTRMLRSD